MIPAFGAFIAAAWAALALAGGVQSGDVNLTAAGAAAACGAAVVASTVRPHPRDTLWLGPAAAILVVPTAVAWAASGRHAAALFFLLAPVAGAAGVDGDGPPLPSLAGLVGAALAVAGLVASSGGLRPWELAPDGSDAALLLVGGGALLAFAGAAARPGGVGRILAVPGLVIALAAVPEAPERVVAVGASAAVVATAVLLRRAPASLALLAVAAAAASTIPAPRLLAAGAVVAMAVAVPLASAVLALPGLVALASALSGMTVSVSTVSVGAAALVVLGLLAGDAPSARRPDLGEVARLPAFVLGAWLVLLPTTWRWAGVAPEALATYERGALQAVAAGMITVVGGAILAHLRRPVGVGSSSL